MFDGTAVCKSWLVVAAVAATTASSGMLPPAHARAACEYQFPPFFEIVQNDGWHVTFPVSGEPRRTAGPDLAKYWMSGKPDPSLGTPSGGMTASGVIDIEVPWSNGSVGKFIGSVRSDGIAAGRSSNLLRPEHNFTWMSVQPMECYVAPAPQQAAQADSNQPGGNPLPADQMAEPPKG